MKWIKAKDSLPVIDNKNPKHYVFRNNVNYDAIDIWTEFINRFPPLITARLMDWEWLDESSPTGEATPAVKDKCNTLFFGYGACEPKDRTGCLKEYAHNDDHIFKDEKGQFIEWSDDESCKCGCLDDNDDKVCKVFKVISEKEATEKIKKSFEGEATPAPGQKSEVVEAAQLFDNNSDCYADTGKFLNDGGYTEGEVIPAMTKDAFLKLLPQLKPYTPPAGAAVTEEELERMALESANKRFPQKELHELTNAAYEFFKLGYKARG